jgi:1-acyl-sn-glycerol-3-phosphate acyltransferase
MTLAAFHEGLRATGRYQTPEPSRQAKPCFAATCRFHIGLSAQMIACGWDGMHRRFGPAAQAARSLSILQFVERLGGRVSFEDFQARAAHRGPVVYAANHMSVLETVVLPGGLMAFDHMHVVLKDTLLRYPFFGAACRSTEPIVVTRRNARADLRAVLEQGQAKLAAGASVLLFPQGTRSAVFQTSHFNSIGVKLAQVAGVPLVPVAVATGFVGVGRWIKDLGPVDPRKPIRFAAGPLLDPGLPAREMQHRCVVWLVERLRGWGLPVEADGANSQ